MPSSPLNRASLHFPRQISSVATVGRLQVPAEGASPLERHKLGLWHSEPDEHGSPAPFRGRHWRLVKSQKALEAQASEASLQVPVDRLGAHVPAWQKASPAQGDPTVQASPSAGMVWQVKSGPQKSPSFV